MSIMRFEAFEVNDRSKIDLLNTPMFYFRDDQLDMVKALRLGGAASAVAPATWWDGPERVSSELSSPLHVSVDVLV